MKTELTIGSERIDEGALVAQRARTDAMGAAVYFSGMVRGLEQDRPIGALEYEAFQAMAEHQFRLLFAEMERRWPVGSVRVAHRTGVVRVGECSLWIEVVAPHRAEAFAACEWLIDELKRVVPIWKHPVAPERPLGPG